MKKAKGIEAYILIDAFGESTINTGQAITKADNRKSKKRKKPKQKPKQ